MDEELKLFLEDVNDQIEMLEEELVSLEDKKDPQTINMLFRAAHTLKGISATFGAPKMQELTHRMESVFQKIRDEKKTIHQELITVLLHCVDVLKTLRDDIEAQKESHVDVQSIVTQLDGFDSASTQHTTASPSPAELTVVEPGEKKQEPPAAAAPALDPEELKLFLEDVSDQIEFLEEGLVALEEHKDPQTINTLFRAAHTLKGVSATFGAQKMQELTHQMESVFQKIRDEGRDVEQELVTTLLSCADILKTLKKDIEENRQSTIDVKNTVVRLKNFESGAGAGKPVSSPAALELSHPAEKKTSVQTVSSARKRQCQVSVRLKAGTELPSVRLIMIVQELKSRGDIVAIVPPEEKLSAGDFHSLTLALLTDMDAEEIKKSVTAFEEVDDVQVRVETALAPKASVLDERKADDISLKGKKTIRLDMERVEALMNITSELVIEKNRLLQIAQLFMKEEYEERQEIKAMLESKEQLDKKISFLQDEMLKVRMVSLDALFKKFPRAVRDAALKAKKEVKFAIAGASVELDKTVIDELSDPLIHLLRNAVDHGIAEKGEVVLSARQAEGNVFIEVSDNGQGVDLERVKQKALEKGLVTEEQVKKYSDKDVMELLFMPGFSTKEKVSDLSGRGVGLDVVKENIKKIHGSIEIQTEKGKGTRFILKIPLTLAIIKSLLVLSAGQKFAIALSSVHEIVQVEKEEIQTVKTKEAILLRGNVLPLFWLSDLLELPEFDHDPPYRKVVVVTYQERKVGFVIDTLLGEQEIVVYTLGKFIGEVPGISGATIDSEGRVALILDVPSLVSSTLM